VIEPNELARRRRLRHANTAPHDLEGDALHALRSAEGVLLAGAARYAAHRAAPLAWRPSAHRGALRELRRYHPTVPFSALPRAAP
jgi:hypothetical protein